MRPSLSLIGGLRRTRRAARAVASVVWVVAVFGCDPVERTPAGPTPTANSLATTSTPPAAGAAPATPSVRAVPSSDAVDAGRALPAASAVSTSAAAIDMVFWEKQVWKPGGGAQRLTLWADGRAEAWVTSPSGWTQTPPLPLRPGWRRVPGEVQGERLRWVRSNAFPRAEAKRRFAQAVAAGIERLETFKPHYKDGGGTLVGSRRGGKVQEIVLPIFPDAQKGSENEQRYLRVAEAFAGYDAKPF